MFSRVKLSIRSFVLFIWLFRKNMDSSRQPCRMINKMENDLATVEFQVHGHSLLKPCGQWQSHDRARWGLLIQIADRAVVNSLVNLSFKCRIICPRRASMGYKTQKFPSRCMGKLTVQFGDN